MRSEQILETTVFMQDGVRMYAYSHKKSNTLTAFGSKEVFTITVFHSPIPEALEAVKRQLDGPSAELLVSTASDIVAAINETFNDLKNGLPKKD